MIADHHQQNNNSTDSDDTLANLSVKDLTQMKREIEKNLRQIEQQIFNLEGNYLEETGNFGNVVKGFEGYLSTRARASQSTRKTKFKDSDRIFSNSSYVLIPAISSHPSDKSSTAGMLLNGSSGESSVARGMDDHAATAKIRKNAATMTPSAHTNEKSLTGNITFVDEHSNPLRKEVALSEENKDLVFQTNARKRKLPASDQNIQKRRRRKVSRHLLLSQQEGEGEELDDKTNKKKEVVASTSRTENASIPSENRRAEETPVAATTTDAVLLEKKQKREKSKPTKDNEHDSTPTTGDPPQKAQALSAQSATSQQESRKTNSDRLTKPSTPEKTNLDNDELLAGQEEDSLDVVSPGGDGDNEDKDHVVDEDEEDDEADEEEVDGDDDETMTTVTSGHDDDFVSSITAASGNVDSVTEGSVLEDHSSEEE